MALNRWSLEGLLGWVGSLAVFALFIPAALYVTRNVVACAEGRLEEQGRSAARTLAGQVVDPLLFGDRLSVHEALDKALEADPEARYLYVTDAGGEVVSHTFSGSVPKGLLALGRSSAQDVIRFRTDDDRLLEVCEPILSGQLGALHVGLSRGEAVRASRRALWVLGATLMCGLSVVLVGARLVARGVSRPLEELAERLNSIPDDLAAGRSVGAVRVCGTREVAALAGKFEQVADHLAALERDRAATQRRMIQAERLAALGELAAGLAHEIQNPVDGMLECVHYLDREPVKSARLEKYLPMFHSGLDRIARVMRHMLTLARTGQDLSMEAKAARDVVGELVLMTEKQLEARGVRLSVEGDDDCSCHCNANALSQAMLNLMLNACDAVDGRGRGEVRLETRCDAEWVHLSVEDSGPGVPEELQERIFAPLFTTRPTGKGTGLGLSISRDLVRAAGGELELAEEPSPLGGARFVVRLPRACEMEGCHAPGESQNPDRG